MYFMSKPRTATEKLQLTIFFKPVRIYSYTYDCLQVTD